MSVAVAHRVRGRRTARWLPVIVVLAVLLSQCAVPGAREEPEEPGGPRACEREHDGPARPGTDDAPLFRAQSNTYDTSTDQELMAGPHLAVYADGTAARVQSTDDAATPLAHQDPLTPPVGGWIDPCTFNWFTEQLDELGNADYGRIDSAEDGGSLSFVIDHGTGADPVTVAVDQFGLEAEEPPDFDLTSSQYDARQRLKQVLAEIKAAFHETGPLPDRIRIAQYEAATTAAEQPVAPWPGLSSAQACEIVTGREAQEARQYLQHALIQAVDTEMAPIAGSSNTAVFADPSTSAAPNAQVMLMQALPGTGHCEALDEDLLH